MQTILNIIWKGFSAALRYLAILALSTSIVVAAKKYVEVTGMEGKVNVTLMVNVDKQQATAVIKFTNKTQHDVYLDKINACISGEIENDVFQISTNGKEIRYIGMLQKRHVKPEDFIKLKPGAEIETKVKLEKTYQFLAGKNEYKIRYYAYHSHPQGEDLHLVSDYIQLFMTIAQ